MNHRSRTHNSIRNTLLGISAHAITTLFSFVSRTVFVNILGVHYLGISGLFSNIFMMLALSDLGMYTVMLYSLYKPLAEQDYRRVSALIRFYQKVYNVLAVVVFVLGILCIPILPYIIKDSVLSQKESICYYILLLVNTSVSYLAISRSTLLRADQQMHIVQIVSSVSTFVLQISQIFVLLITKRYEIYLCIQVILTLGSNFVQTYIASKKYPYLTENYCKIDESGIKKEIVSNFRATFLYKIGNVLLNSIDNILISAIIGTAFVGYYSNYVTIFSMVNSFIMIFIQAIIASVGNYYATNDATNKYMLFRTLLLGFYAIATLCAMCYICGMDDFIRMWLGDAYIIGGRFALTVAISRFVFCIVHPLWITRESTGVFKSTQYVMILAAAINLLLSIILGNVVGISGIIIATALSYLLTVFWYEPIQLCKKVFKTSAKGLFIYNIRLIISALPCFVVAVVLEYVHAKNFILLLFKFIFCAFVTFFSFYLFMRRSQEFKRIQKLFCENINKLLKK